MPKKHNGSSRGFTGGKTCRAYSTANKPPVQRKSSRSKGKSGRSKGKFVPFNETSNPTPGHTDVLNTIRRGQSII